MTMTTAANDPQNPGPEGLDALRLRYLRHLQLKNLSPLTVKQEDQAIRFFHAYLRAEGIERVQDVVRDTVEAYKAHMQAARTRAGLPLASETVRGRLFIVQRWFLFLRRKGILLRDPAATVQAPRHQRRPLAGVMSQDEVLDVLKQPDPKTVLGQRDLTMISTLYATGARAAELLALKLGDINLVKKVIRIRRGKGQKDRLVPLNSAAIGHIARYLEVTRPKLAEGNRPAGNNWKKKYRTGGDTLFLSVYGGAITKTWLGAVMKMHLRSAGIVRRVSPVHGFRHSVATHLLENGMDIRFVQGMLGHASVGTTARYTRVNRKNLKAQVDKHHPRPKLGGPFRPFVDRRPDARQ